MGDGRTVGKTLMVGAAAAFLSRRPSLLPRTGEDQALVSAGAALMGGAAGAAAGVLAARLGRRLPGGRTAASALLAGVGLCGWLAATRREKRGAAASALESASITTAFAAGVGEAGVLLSDRLFRLPQIAIAAKAGSLAVAAGAALVALKRRLAEPADLHKATIAYDYLPSVSGRDGSLVSLDSLDREGRKFLGLAVPARAIEDVMGRPAQDPIRVYVGLESAPSAQERVRLAVAELDRAGGFARRRLLVGCPTGSGLVNPVLVQAEEYMSRGDVATVVVQYGNERSHRSLGQVPIARDTYFLLLEALRERLRELPEGARPELAVYGESLGAWVAAEMVAFAGTEVLEELEIGRAILCGIPYEGAYKLVRLRERAGVLPESIGVFSGADELEQLPAERRAALRYAVVTHPEDPVANYTGPQLLWRRPFWLPPGRLRHPRVPRGMRWMPGITFLQVLFDVKNGTSFTAEFHPRAHDYRAEHAAIVRIVFGHDGVSAAQLAAIEDRLAASARAQKERELAARTPR